jgi:hypothetical protein
MRSLLKEEPKPQEIEIPPEGISLDLLRAVYRSNHLPLTVRLRAAVAALPHEVPKLAVTYQATEQDFATLLDRRLERMKEVRQIEAQPTPPVEVKPPLPRLPDRRCRRI